jgi:pyruvate dehydrogenase E2 component (dihydrolipoamide acetyltransferase)
MAARSGLDLATVTGSGPGGRIVKADIEAALKGGAAPVPSIEAPTVPRPTAVPATAPANGDYTEVPHSTMRKVIARRLTESKQTVPHFYLTIECEIDRLLAIRKELSGRDEGGTHLSVNDFVIKAAALALARVPAANASWTDTAIRRHNSVDVAVAVALKEGLITPIIRHADHKGLATISTEMRDLAGRAREGKLMPEEYQGGTFSISNLGMFGIREFAAVINPPQGAILAIGAGEQRAVVKDDALAVATVMSCTLSADHRVVDGAVGANLLKLFKSLIEDPLTMFL